MQSSHTLNDGTRISYWVYHPKAPVTMVLIHGFTGSHEGFQYIIPFLPHIRFIVPDLPGFGKSDLSPNGHTIDGIAQLTNEFIAACAPPKPYLLGHSMGGLVVSSMVDQAPQLYHRKLTLLSPVPTAIHRNDSRRIGAILGALQYHLGHRLPKVGDKLVKSRRISAVATKLISTTTDKDLQRAIRKHHYDNLDYISDIAFYSKLHKDINRQGSIDHAAALKKFDVLLMTGDADNVTPLKEQLKFAEAIKPKQLVIIPGVGHLAHYERAEEVAGHIQTFIG